MREMQRTKMAAIIICKVEEDEDPHTDGERAKYKLVKKKHIRHWVAVSCTTTIST